MAKARKKIKKKAVKKADRKVGKKGVSVVLEKSTEPAPAKPKVTPYPQAGPKVQEFEDLLDKQLAGDTQPSKRPVGRPRGEKPQEPEQPELTLDVVAGVIKIPFELWAIGQDVKQLALTKEESLQMAEPARQLLEYYLPKIPVIAYAWLSLSVSAFWVMRVRLLLIQELRKQRRKQQPPKPAEPAQPGVVTNFPSEIKTNKV